ncbi:hypothetical protein P7K49_015647 [Saguinus oedipus]|uniref:Uncharacterized protein n=1 Tax=Saguinus oedipus TaxID=9490 RepID=A0ABQ9VBV4_SAGOE|nr:hypothetical protein P7K49_015647 [Saguinus oedipus]
MPIIWKTLVEHQLGSVRALVAICSGSKRRDRIGAPTGAKSMPTAVGKLQAAESTGGFLRPTPLNQVLTSIAPAPRMQLVFAHTVPSSKEVAPEPQRKEEFWHVGEEELRERILEFLAALLS